MWRARGRGWGGGGGRATYVSCVPRDGRDPEQWAFSRILSSGATNRWIGTMGRSPEQSERCASCLALE